VFRLVPLERRTDGSGIGSWDTLTSAARASWPTPQEHDETGPRGKNNTMSDGHYFPHDLATAATVWPTPAAQNAERGTTDPTSREGHNPNLQEAAFGTMQSGSLARTENFVERLTTLSAWLMGYTVQYLALWATASSRKSRTRLSKP